MIPEFSIKNIKGDDVIEVCKMIENVTSVRIESYILNAIETGKAAEFIDTLNLITYLAFKTLLVKHSENKALHEKLKKFDN